MFPNPYLVYLHDAPSHALFERERRAFSSGCIRSKRPLELAEPLLANTDRWSLAKIETAVASGTTLTIRLPKPVPVLILYWTVERDDQGAIVFKPDPYGRDPKLLKALDRPYSRPNWARLSRALPQNPLDRQSAAFSSRAFPFSMRFPPELIR
jgi:murein L,D-transpeptidase YcbB/YkuD